MRRVCRGVRWRTPLVLGLLALLGVVLVALTAIRQHRPSSPGPSAPAGPFAARQTLGLGLGLGLQLGKEAQGEEDEEGEGGGDGLGLQYVPRALQELQVELLARQRSGPTVLLAVITNAAVLQSDLGRAMLGTWVRVVGRARLGRVIFFVGRTPELRALRVLVAEAGAEVAMLGVQDDKYPPQDKVLAMWEYLFQHHASQPAAAFDFYCKLDQDTFVNPLEVHTLIKRVAAAQSNFVGLAYRGRDEERPKLGLESTYCSGLGYFISQKGLLTLGPAMRSCRADLKSDHSDTEVGRCMYNSGAAPGGCKQISPYSLIHNVYAPIVKGVTYGWALETSGQSVGMFSDRPDEYTFRSGLVHPMKQARDVLRFYQQVMFHLRPIRAIPEDIARAGNMAKALQDRLRDSCTNHAVSQAGHGLKLRRCTLAPVRPAWQLAPVLVVVEFGSQTVSPQQRALLNAGWTGLQVTVTHPRPPARPNTALDPLAPGFGALLQAILQGVPSAASRTLVIIPGHAAIACGLEDRIHTTARSAECGAGVSHVLQAGVVGVPARLLKVRGEDSRCRDTIAIDRPFAGLLFHPYALQMVVQWHSSPALRRHHPSPFAMLVDVGLSVKTLESRPFIAISKRPLPRCFR